MSTSFFVITVNFGIKFDRPVERDFTQNPLVNTSYLGLRKAVFVNYA